VRDRRKISELIENLGVSPEVKDGELLAGAVVLLKVVDEDGEVMLRSSWSDGMSWMERVGMLRAAERSELPPPGAEGWHVDP
jgi:hypothetical protein